MSAELLILIAIVIYLLALFTVHKTMNEDSDIVKNSDKVIRDFYTPKKKKK